MRVVTSLLATLATVVLLGACGPAPAPDNADCPEADLATDPQNCGQCERVCGPGQTCNDGACSSDCTPGDTLACYDASAATDGVGPTR